MADCLFCLIAGGRIPSAELYQDDRVFAFLDINPLADGHTLIVPKRHAAKLEDTATEDAAAMLQAARLLAPHLCKATGDPDCTIAINNGPAAGQEVQHVHLHLIPRRKGDGAGPVHALFAGTKKVHSEALHDLAIRVQIALEAETPRAHAARAMPNRGA